MTTGKPTILIMDANEYVGPELARRLISTGRALLLHGADEKLAASLRELGGDIRVVGIEEVPLSGAGSVATGAGAQRLVDECVSEFGRIDAALVRSSGFAMGSLLDVSEEAFTSVKQNLDVTFHMLRALVPAMRSQGDGNIVVVTSAHAQRPTADFSVYSAVRAAETALMRSAALAYAADGVAINAVGTNYMRFPQFRGGWSDEYEEMRFETPRHALGTMSELSELCALLLEGRARHLIGQFISMTGGW